MGNGGTMSALDALLGTISEDGAERELGSGLNFVGLLATPNPATLKIDISPGNTTPVRGTENYQSDTYPSTQLRGTVNTGGNVTHDVAVAVGKRYRIDADVWVDDGAGGACLFTKALAIIAHQTAGAAVEVVDTTVHTFGASFTFLSAPAGTNIRFTLANTSGTNRPYNIVIKVTSLDKP